MFDVLDEEHKQKAVNLLREQGAYYNSPGICLGKIISVDPLQINYRNMPLNRNRLLISKHLLSITLIIQVILFIFLKDYTKSILLINIPLLISYLKRKELTSIILSILIAYYYVFLLNYNLYFIFFEYVLYYVIYYIVTSQIYILNFILNKYI